MADVTPLHRSPSVSGGGDDNTGDEQQQQAAASQHTGAPPRIILHRIASYLSLDDAESMASLSRPSPHYYYSYSAATPSRHHHLHGSNSNISNSGSSGNNMGLMTGYHSLDYHFYHTIGGGDATASSGGARMNNNFRRSGGGEDYDGNNSHVSLLGSNSSVGGSATAATSTQQQQQQRQNSPNNDDEEDWFVGGRGQTPGLVALSPLEEEFYGPGGVGGGGGGGDNDGYNNLQNIPISTPAGQPTSESEGGSGGGGGGGSRMGITGILRSSSSSRRKMITDSQHDDGDNYNNEGLKRSSDDDNIILDGSYNENDDDSDDLSFFIRREHSLRRQALQHKLAAAVFAHPYPLRQYCLDAYATATKLSMARQKQQQQEQQQLMATLEGKEPPPETSRDDVVTIMSPSTELHGPRDDNSPELGEHQQLREQLHRQRYGHHHHHQGEKRLRKQHQSRAKILRVIISKLLNNAPLSILLDIAESVCDLSLETIFATGKMGLFTIDKCIDILSNTVLNILDLLTSFNPFHIFEHVINLQRSAVGKTGDVVVSGIMSVATGVGSVSNAALNRLSRQGLALAGGVVIAGAGSRSGRSGSHDYGRSRKDTGAGGNPLDSKVSMFLIGKIPLCELC